MMTGPKIVIQLDRFAPVSLKHMVANWKVVHISDTSGGTARERTSSWKTIQKVYEG